MEKTIKVDRCSPLELAFLGDAILEVYVRYRVLELGYVKVDALHKASVKYVNANTQSAFYEWIFPNLDEEEQVVLKRGRNQKKKTPKNADVQAYRKSTGVESLFGYLYLKGEEERLEILIQNYFEMVEGSQR